MKNDYPSFEHLCHAVLENNASEAELEQFRQRLQNNAADREAYYQQMQIHALLMWQSGRAMAPKLVDLDPQNNQDHPNIIPFQSIKVPAFFNSALGIAAAVAFILGISLWLAQDCYDKILSPASQKGVSVTILESSETPFKPGQQVVLEQLELQTGSIRFRISSGAVVDFKAPVRLEFIDPMRLRLERGTINTNVGDDAKGFVVETPAACMIDIGTRFSTSVFSAGCTQVAVLQGEVEVYRAGLPRTQENRLANLFEGDAAFITDWNSKLERINLLALQGGRLQRRGFNAPSSPLVQNVSDNIRQAKFYPFYTILPGGMSEGALASLTLTDYLQLKWRTMPGQPFPQELLGADLIGTFQSFAKRESGTLAKADINVDLSRPCSVYVLFDTRATPPEWLQRDFHDTGLRLRSGPWGKNAGEVSDLEPDTNGERNVIHSVWRRDVMSAGVVNLGTPGNPGSPYKYAMFGIAVKALE